MIRILFVSLLFIVASPLFAQSYNTSVSLKNGKTLQCQEFGLRQHGNDKQRGRSSITMKSDYGSYSFNANEISSISMGHKVRDYKSGRIIYYTIYEANIKLKNGGERQGSLNLSRCHCVDKDGVGIYINNSEILRIGYDQKPSSNQYQNNRDVIVQEDVKLEDIIIDEVLNKLFPD